MKRRIAVMLTMLTLCGLVAAASFLPVDTVQGSALRQGTMTGTVVIHGSPTALPPVTVTPTLGNYACAGTPIGWGTYTPSPLFLDLCSSCLTPTSTATALPTSTGTPYTPTVTATSTMLVGAVHFTAGSGGCTIVSPSLAHCVYSGTTGAPYSEGFGLTVHNDYSTTADAYFNVYWSASQSNDLSALWTAGFSTAAGFYAGSPTSWPNLPSGSTQTGTMYNAHVVGSSGGNRSFSPYTIHNGSGFHYRTTDFYVSLDPSFMYTPTPAPTPGALSYCATVTGQDSGFDWSLFTADGAPNCSVGWDAFSISDTWTIPAAEICLQPVQIGYVKLFGVQFSLDILALAAAAAFFWRFFRTI